MTVAAVIAAMNEAPTIGEVVSVARQAVLIDEVLVVDGASTDDTAARAAAVGARVLQQQYGGKGEAMAAGVQATDAEVIVFLDADLTGLRPHHVDRLARAVTAGGAVMACGLFDRGRWLNRLFLHLLPILTGERAVRRDLFAGLTPRDRTGWRIEAALNARAGELGLPVAAFVCQGMWHRTKQEKLDTPLNGWLAKVRMLAVAVGGYAGYWLRRRLRRRPAPAPSRYSLSRRHPFRPQ